LDATGKLISSAHLSRPLSITGMWTEATANRVYAAWNSVSLQPGLLQVRPESGSTCTKKKLPTAASLFSTR
jgi:hypothetical protein